MHAGKRDTEAFQEVMFISMSAAAQQIRIQWLSTKMLL
jgi:hypothetical protein